MERSDSPRPVPSRFVSFARRLPPLAPVFVAPFKPDAGLRPGVFGSGNPDADQSFERWRPWGVPSSWGTLVCLRPVLRPRRDRPYQAAAVGRRGPTRIVRRGLSTRGNFGAPSHGIGTGCLRFARWVTRTGRKTRFWLLARLYQAGFGPAGFRRKVSVMSLTSVPPFPSFLAQTMSPFSPP
jgi:hypothetical protein